MAGITRTEAAALFTEAFSARVLGAVQERSVALATIPTVPMPSKVVRQPVLAALPTARFLTAEGEVKPESKVSWDNVILTAEEIAVIVPVDDTVLADSNIDVIASVEVAIASEFARVLDAAVFFGTGAPASYPTGGIRAKSAEVAYTNGESWGALFDKVEVTGGTVTDLWAAKSARGLLRNAKDVGNVRIPEVSVADVHGVAPAYPLGWDATDTLAIAGDDSAAVIGVRQDLTFSISNQATLTGFGSLWEKDATAIRAVMRVGFALANPISIHTGTRVYPFAALTPPAAP